MPGLNVGLGPGLMDDNRSLGLAASGRVVNLKPPQGVTTGAGGVTSWSSISPAGGPVASQGTEANRPGLTDRAVEFNGTSDYLQFASALTTSTALTILAVVSHDGSPGSQYIIDNGATRLGFGVYTDGTLYWYDTATRGASVAIGVGYQVVGLVLDGAGNGYIRKGGSVVDTDTSANHTLDGTIALGARNDGASAYFGGSIRALDIWSRVLTTPELTQAEAYLGLLC